MQLTYTTWITSPSTAGGSGQPQYLASCFIFHHLLDLLQVDYKLLNILVHKYVPCHSLKLLHSKMVRLVTLTNAQACEWQTWPVTAMNANKANYPFIALLRKVFNRMMINLKTYFIALVWQKCKNCPPKFNPIERKKCIFSHAMPCNNVL